MKKTLFLAAVASLAMSSCSNDEVIMESPQSAITFDSFVGKTIRATDATAANLSSIYVYGYIGGATPVKNFDGTLVKKTGGTWGYSPIQYWTAGKDYFFTAVSSAVETEGNNHYTYTWPETLPTDPATFNGTGTIGFNQAAAAGNEDVIYAIAKKTTPDPMTTNPGVVEFAFKHALSRVKFSFKNEMGSDAYTIKVYDLTINNATSGGNLVLGDENPAWTGNGETTSLTLRNNLYKTPTAANNGTVVSGTKFIIPAQDAPFKITFKIDLIVNGGVIATYTHTDKALPETTFQNGHSYNFTATINPDNIDPVNDNYPIEFSVISVDDWATDTDVTVTL